jgi:hypothetical protein
MRRFQVLGCNVFQFIESALLGRSYLIGDCALTDSGAQVMRRKGFARVAQVFRVPLPGFEHGLVLGGGDDLPLRLVVDERLDGLFLRGALPRGLFGAELRAVFFLAGMGGGAKWLVRAGLSGIEYDRVRLFVFIWMGEPPFCTAGIFVGGDLPLFS